MFGLNKNMQRQLKGWLYTALLILVGLLFGQEHFPSQRQTSPSAPLPDAVKGAGRTIDGDSLWVGKDEVRLKGIDAPEGRQTCQRDGRDWACGDAARDELRRLIGKDMVECRAVERDKHGRVLGYCKAGGRDLNAGMVASGFALAYGSYLREEGEAKSRRRGLWAGEFERPRDWRHERGVGL
jgi:endonuclease YncB( thermonuclease family)